MSEEDDTYSTIFTALKHPLRRRILRRLQASPATYTELLNELSIENGLLNYHLESIRELITKQDDGRYTLNEFGRAGIQLLQRVEEPANVAEKVKVSRRGGNWLGTNQMLGVIIILIVGIASLSGLSFLLFNNYMSQEKVLNTQIDSLNQRVSELSKLEELVNLSKPPQPLGAGSGVQIVKSYPMEFDYNYPNYDESKTIITIYVPNDNSVASLDLFVDPFSAPNRYPLNITLQRGDAWVNQTWVKAKTYSSIDDLNETITTVVWEAAVIWSLNTTESGLINTPQLSRGWYTLSMFGPVRHDVSTWVPAGQVSTPLPGESLHYLAKIDSYRVIITVTILNNGAQGFFAESSDWFR